MLSAAFTWILNNQAAFGRALGQHLTMSALAMAAGLAIGLTLAVALVGRPALASRVIGAVNAVRTVPSLAILALAMPVLGFGLWPTVVALTVLAIPPILLNAYTGLSDTDPAALDAATGMGMSAGQILRRIRMPLAAPAMFAGTRTAAVQVLAGATLAPFIGGGGLGDFITLGIALNEPSRLIVGAAPIAILALGTEAILAGTERHLFRRRAA